MRNIDSFATRKADVRPGLRARLETSAARAVFVAMAMVVTGATGAGADSFALTSPDIGQGARIADEQVYDRGDCKGGNVSPALAWSGAPAATRSFAVSMFDPGAPSLFSRAKTLVAGLFRANASAAGFWHWWVVDIPADVTSLPKGAGSGAGLPSGAAQGRTTFGATAYGGPCPPLGPPHHYEITVYALDVARLDVDPATPPAAIGAAVNQHTLAKASITGVWGR